jgi:hypothetical protein
MGANAVTTVPVYTAGEVLTAADMNITNSGIPVFATTVTRDAAFDGAGEKTLAEGQFAYIEATNTTQYYDGSAWKAVNESGLDLITTGTLSTASTNFAGCFTSAYRNYKIVLDSVTFSNTSNLWVRLLVSTTPNTTSNYAYAGLGWTVGGAAANYANTVSYFLVGQGQTNNFSNSYNNTVLEVITPQEAIRTSVLAITNANETGYVFRTGGGTFDLTTQFDGIQFLSGSAVTLGGNVSIYGYRK